MNLNKIEKVLNEHVEAYDALYYQYIAADLAQTQDEEDYTMSGRQVETILFILGQKIEQLRNAYAALKEVEDVVHS